MVYSDDYGGGKQMIVMMKVLMSAKSFLLARYNKKDNDKFLACMWTVSGIVWMISAIGEIAKIM